MPERIQIPAPAPYEDRRLLTESIADLHYVVSVIVENAKELVPGGNRFN